MKQDYLFSTVVGNKFILDCEYSFTINLSIKMIRSSDDLKKLRDDILDPLRCSALDDILREKCETTYSQMEYFDQQREYRLTALKNLITDGFYACYSGNINVELGYNKDAGEKKTYQWADVSSFKYSLNKLCVTNIVDINIAFGEYGKKYFPQIYVADIKGVEESLNPNRVLYYAKNRDTIGHSNIIIIKNGIITRIEPNGWAPYNDVLDKELEHFFNLKHGGTLQYKKSELICGVQNDQKCGSWTLLLVYLYVKCPDIRSIDQLQDLLVRKGGAYLNELMDKWSCFLNRKATELLFTKKASDVTKGLVDLLPTIDRYYDDLGNIPRGKQEREEHNSIILMYTQQVYEVLSRIAMEFKKRNLMKDDSVREVIDLIKRDKIYKMPLIKNIMDTYIKTPYYVYLSSLDGVVKLYNSVSGKDIEIQKIPLGLFNAFAIYRYGKIYLMLESESYPDSGLSLYSYDIDRNQSKLLLKGKYNSQTYNDSAIYFNSAEETSFYRYNTGYNTFYKEHQLPSDAPGYINEKGILTLANIHDNKYYVNGTELTEPKYNEVLKIFTLPNYTVFQSITNKKKLYIYSISERKVYLYDNTTMADNSKYKYTYGDFIQIQNPDNLGVTHKLDIKKLLTGEPSFFVDNGPQLPGEIIYKDDNDIYFTRGVNNIMHLNIKTNNVSIYDSVPTNIITEDDAVIGLIFV